MSLDHVGLVLALVCDSKEAPLVHLLDDRALALLKAGRLIRHASGRAVPTKAGREFRRAMSPTAARRK